ncbi:hypothetical protein J3459_020112 [Metarhizium acridum]|nr:hypothetical protein J3459_020112 [Metarhizium acridum]
MPMCEKLAKLKQHEAEFEAQGKETGKLEPTTCADNQRQAEATIEALERVGRQTYNYGLPDPEDTEQEEEQQELLNWIEQQSIARRLQEEEEIEILDRQPEETLDDNFKIKSQDDEDVSESTDNTSESEDM